MIVLDKIHYVKSFPCPKSKKPCRVLKVKDLERERPPVYVVEMDKSQRRRRGRTNEVRSVAICMPCWAPKTVWRRPLYPGVHMSEQDITRVVKLGQLDIGPPVYAVDADAVYMQEYDGDLRDYLIWTHRKEDLGGREIAEEIMRLVEQVALNDLVCTDMKPRNAVVLVDRKSGRVHKLRLIDFDSDFCFPITKGASRRKAVWFVMTFHFFLHVRHLHITSATKTRMQKHMRRVLADRVDDMDKDELGVVLRQHGQDFKHYFGQTYTVDHVRRMLSS